MIRAKFYRRNSTDRDGSADWLFREASVVGWYGSAGRRRLLACAFIFSPHHSITARVIDIRNIEITGVPLF